MKSPLRVSKLLLAIPFLLYLCGALNAFPASPFRPPTPDQVAAPADAQGSITIPGPLRSFLRMAAISQKVTPNQVLPLLARNVVMEGYGWSGKTAEPSEYLILLKGYLIHARALMSLAGPKGVIRVPDCAAVQPLLKVLGYKLRGPCGPDASVQTADPKEAFLTIDSGFPLTDLVDALRANKPFTYPISSSEAPVLFSPAVWIANDTGKRRVRKGKNSDLPHDMIESIVDDPTLARLYWAMARMDVNTREYLVRKEGIDKLVGLAPVLDFYGSNICIRSGRVMVPGGPAADHAWQGLVGASPGKPDAFIMRMLEKDDGWLAAYFSALSRVSPAQAAYFTSGGRLRTFYEALRGDNPEPGATSSVFRPNPGLVLFVTRLQLNPSGGAHVPGGLASWKQIFRRDQKDHSKLIRLWAGKARDWKHPDQVVATMFALSRVYSENNPLRLFLVLNSIDQRRPADQQLSPRIVRLLADNYRKLGDQYHAFSEFQNLDDSSIESFLRVANSLDRIREHSLRADAVGIFQANIGLWQILARQSEIPSNDWSRSWNEVVRPFAKVQTPLELLAATRTSLTGLVHSADSSAGLSQQEVIDLLAGPAQTGPEDQRIRQDLAYRIGSVMVAQRLVPIETLFALSDGLDQMAHGKPASPDLIHVAGDLRELPKPKPLFTNGERIEWTNGYYGDPHLQEEGTINFTKVIRAPESRKKLADARGLVVPFLRDTLVGLNYAYYQPPGSQMLYNDPNFVRSHDFLGESTSEPDQYWKDPVIIGRGWTAGGGAHLEGSLANLPYVLAEVDQDFIAPRNVQALIWEDMVSTLLMNSVVPRWWGVTPAELHAAALYQEYGDELVAAAAGNERLRQEVMNILSNRMMPAEAGLVDEAIRQGKTEDAMSILSPDDAFSLAANFRGQFPDEAAKWGKAGQELDSLAQQYPDQVNLERIGRDFGVPHPTLAGTYARGLLNVRPFPTYLGYSSRLLAESWQSDNLYWARLADQMGYPPAMLNLLVPQLTHEMIARIFATDLDDRPALLRAMWATGEDFLKSHAAASTKNRPASGS
ncbi:MAG: hypothetical protein KGM47_06635 [Acidobacteriota bacterium]|nr:hypothetical protein [Acidobacteriota bacterium]